MAYQNIGTPRFWVDTLSWLIANGVPYSWQPNAGDATSTTGYREAGIGFNPSKIYEYTAGVVGGGTYFMLYIEIPANYPLDFCAILGHDYGGKETGMYGATEDDSGFRLAVTDKSINAGVPSGHSFLFPPYDGFSIWKLTDDSTGFNVAGQSSPWSRFQLYNGHMEVDTTYKTGSVALGTTYTMPHSPELSLTMTREMDGVKRIRTKGGADLVNHRYTKPAPWGDAAPWELYTGTPANQELSRSGRRIWDLSFNYLQASDMFGLNQTQSTTNSNTDYHGNLFLGSDYDDGDINMHSDPTGTGTDTHGNFNYNLLTDDNFFSQVIHKTNGGQLPFIFQPDSSNNNPDQFAICKLDMKSFKFDQVANGIYNIKLKIREVW